MPDFFATWTSTLLLILKWLLLGLLLTSSGIWNRTLLAIALGLGLALVAVGALFKIEHWAFGDQLLISGAIVVAIAYGLWFRAKPRRELPDYLKLAWVLTKMGAVVAMSLFLPLLKPLAGLSEALFWAMALLYVYQRWVRRPVPESE